MAADDLVGSDAAVELVKLAIAATPASNNLARWRENVGEMICEVAMAASEHSAMAKRAEKFLQAKVIKGVIVGLELEDQPKPGKDAPSMRGIVRIRPTTGEGSGTGEIEEFRTERVDNATWGGPGIWRRLQEFKGWECSFWIYNEPLAGGGAKRKTARTLQHFIPRTRPEGSESAEGGRNASHPSAGDNPAIAIQRKIVKEAGPEGIRQYQHRLTEAGITNPLRLEPAQVETARQIAREVVAAVKEAADVQHAD